MGDRYFFKHKIFLLAIFILGNTVIVFPKGIGTHTAFYSLLLSLVPTAFLTYALTEISKLSEKIPRLAEYAVAIFCIIIFIISARDYVSFVDEMRLPKTPRIIISVIFVAICVLLGLVKSKVLYLFSLFSLIVTALIFVTVFLFSINHLDFGELRFPETDFKTLLRQSLTFFIHSFGQLIVPAFFLIENKDKPDKKIYLWGILTGFVLIIIYVLNIILVLGGNAASNVQYPYAALTGLVSFGRNFSRLDGFTYYVYFYSSLIKCAVAVKVILSTVKFNKKTAAVVLTAVLMVLCNIGAVQSALHSDLANLIMLIFEIAFPAFLLIYLKIKARRIQ